MRRLFGALFALSLALAGPAAAQAPGSQRSFEGAFTIIARGMRAGAFTYRFSQSGERYEISAQRRLNGAARVMMGANQDFAYSVRGAVIDGALRPQAYQHRGGRRAADRPEGRLVRVSFGGEVTTVATPPMPMGDPPATAAQKRGAVDQLTAIASLITARGNPCGRTVRVFLDGRARFDFVLAAASPTHINSSAFRGEGVRCSVRYQPIAGFVEPQQARTLTFTFGRSGAGLWAPLVFELPTDAAGVVRLEARSLSVNGQALS